MPQLVSRADAARLKGVSGAAITKACRKQLAPALVDGRIDLEHDACRAYFGAALDARPAVAPPAPKTDGAPTEAPKTATDAAGAPTKVRRGKPPEPSGPTPAGPPKESPPPNDTVKELDEFASLLRPLVSRFGTARSFRDYLAALKELETIREKVLGNDETEGRLISRELVKTHILGAIDAANRRLLSDAPKTIARLVYASAKSGGSVEQAEQIAREQISSHLKPVATTAARLVRNA
jgi:hypothetical protein